MDETGTRERRLSDVVREMKIAEAERLDAADREGESSRRRLELLADELGEVFEEAGGEEAGFDFTISQGAAPRLWIDAATHVVVGPDGRTFRILRDARGGRTVLGETDDVDEAADRVTRYIATRSLERERLLDDGPATAAAAAPVAATPARRAARSGLAGAPMAHTTTRIVRKPSRTARFIRSILWMLVGAALGIGLVVLAYGERVGLPNPVPLEYRGFYEPYVPPLPGDPPRVVPEVDGAGEAVEPVEPAPAEETES